MRKAGVLVVLAALAGAVVGAAIGFFGVPHPSRYELSANVAFLPAADLTTVEASSFWEVLTRGQITRTAAVVYGDPRWVASAASAAKLPQSEVSVTAAALPDTTVLKVTATANSAAGAEAVLNDVVTNATTEVTSLVAPYSVKVLMPPKGGAVPVPAPTGTQLAAAGAVGGLLIGGGVGLVVARRRTRSTADHNHLHDRIDDDEEAQSRQ